MIKKIIKEFLKFCGYELKPINKNIEYFDDMTLFKYATNDGSFDYEQYKRIQIEANKRKIESSWVKKENVKFLSKYLKNNVKNLQFGICHGTRQGFEQEWFSKYLECKVLGTEISDNANEYKNTIEWDFHNVKKEWIASVDFIYSNALDHSYDPNKCLNAWMSCIREDGLCIIEHTSSHETSNSTDPFGAKISKMPFLILAWGNGQFFPIEILNAPSSNNDRYYTSFIIIKKKSG